MKKEEIAVPIMYYTDNEGNIVYDFEGMAEEFENELSKLDENVVVMCSVREVQYEAVWSDNTERDIIREEEIFNKSFEVKDKDKIN